MNTTIKHGSLAVLVSLLMAGCGSHGSTELSSTSVSPDTISDRAVSASFAPIPFEPFTVTNIDKGTETMLIGWAADDLPIYARYGQSDAMATLSLDYEYLASHGDLVSSAH